MSSAHSPTFLSLHLRHNSFSNSSVALPTSQLILQPFRCFTYVTAHSPILLSLLIRHRVFILQPFHRFTYATVHSPTLLLLHLRHNSLSNPSFASPTSQGSSPGEPPMQNSWKLHSNNLSFAGVLCPMSRI